MDLADRFQLKRKCQDGDMDDLYLNFPNSSIKRPIYDLKLKSDDGNREVNGCHPILTGGEINSPLVFPTKDEMFMMIENRRQFSINDNAPMMTDVEVSISSVPQNSFISSCHPHDRFGQFVANESSHVKESSSIQESPVKSQGCSECLAGKSGHIHHIGRWKLIDSPDGFCQL